MAFGAASFDVAEAIAIARAAQLAQKQREAAERVATACGAASSSGQGPQGSQPKKKERRHRAGGLEGYGGASSSSSSAEEDGEEKEIDLAKFVGAQGNFALQRRADSPSAPPADARKAAQELGLRLCRRGRRAPKPQAAQASSPAEDLASCFPKPGETWEPHYAGEGGRAPVLPEQAEAAPPEWRQGLPGTRHRLGVPPLRRRGPDAAPKQPEQAQEQEGQEHEKEERSWSHQAFAASTDMWFGITGDGATPGMPPLLRYRPQSKEAAEFVPPSRGGHRQAELAPRKPGASVAGQTNWHWERQRNEADQWEAEAPEPTAATKPLPEPTPAPEPGVNHLAKARQLATAPQSSGAAPAEAKEKCEAPELASGPRGSGATLAKAEEAYEVPELASGPRGSGSAPAKAEEAYEAPLEIAEDGPLEVGDRVVVVGLKSRPEINGMLGTLVKMKDEQRWQVVMDEDFSEKIFKAKNLERFSGADGPAEVD